MALVIPDTAAATIAAQYDEVAASYAARKTIPIEFRKQQLRQFWKLADDHEEYLRECLYKDLGKPKVEAQGTEVGLFKNEICYLLDNMDKYLAPETVYVPPAYQGLNPTIVRQPKGVVLVIGAWNYPFFLTAAPFLGAIVAGCTGLMKPPELAPYTAQAMAELVPKYLDTSCYQIVNGAAATATALLTHRWNHIFYTGGSRVGTIVAMAAVKNHTPYTLEMGGKCPVIVTPRADIALSARRVAWGKFACAGQTCVAPDYALVHEDVYDAFIKAICASAQNFFQGRPKEDGRMGRIVNTAHWDRIMKQLRATKGRFVCGGIESADRDDRYVPPTIVADVTVEDALLADEIFGPILPVLKYKTPEEACRTINSIMDEPLGLYVMSEDRADMDWFVDHTKSGDAVHNDTMTQIAVPLLPFGGVGASGLGSYHGKASVDTFSHQRSVVYVPKEAEAAIEWRYPDGDQKLKYEAVKASEEKLPTGL
ncbi:aldehyde dehydrogenase [Grosmannia clavigera kw1407]|uniref:Aldehyde dehydrogenase n=1 Tax=Grosmannia clavigera (strain kw1407 / UAMH 11150) TaxID=655863 RepID=F0XV33_GROCL|nr:aldehyde dehydrogenase [Grosmannia clavigera kw1407]EFW98818.1 aldehyde dehydrogenase [Grosmannia clavigera kw1407]